MKKNFTNEIYTDWMRSTQEKKYKEIMLDFILPLREKIDFDKEKVLDIGVGKAWFEKKMFERGLKADFIGVDVEKTSMSIGGVDFILGSGDYLPFQDSSFNFIVSFDTVHLLKNPSEIERVLKNGGYALISTHCNETNFKSKREKINSLFELEVLKEEIVGDPLDEMSLVVLLKKGP
jgi:SAM-dependent methyltransferase